uniref:Putative chemosensory protein 8 n=1 Tax=Ectropis obliqua TaxID=248899 RepID=A0A1W5LAV1_ECTOB|nr:putative chemosensory protein 8 [Ectropis obliqua]
MKVLVLLTLVFLASARPDNHYDKKYDNFKVDELVSNSRLLKAYALCFLGRSKCTPEGHDIKRWIDEGTETRCAKCTPKQKVLVAKFIKALMEHCPEEWELLQKRSDPEGKQTDELKKFLDEFAP